MTATFATRLRDRAASVIGRTVAGVPVLEPAFAWIGRQTTPRVPALRHSYGLCVPPIVRAIRDSGDPHRRITLHGLRVDVDVVDPTGQSGYFFGELYEPETAGPILARLRAGDVFLDIGANIGYFTILGALRVGPAGAVVAFEPHPHARTRLLDSARRNDVEQRIEVVPVALADREGERPLFLNADYSSYSTLDPSRSPVRSFAAFDASVSVPVTTLDAWFRGRAALLPRVRAVKIDVEGAEDLLVRGMTQTLAALHGILVCETSPGSAADAALKDAGFRRVDARRTYGNLLYERP